MRFRYFYQCIRTVLVRNLHAQVGFVAEQIEPVQLVDGVECVKIRDSSGTEGWVTPDARPHGGQVNLERVAEARPKEARGAARRVLG